MYFANSVETALEQVSNGIEPTLIVILSDINMPGMDGLRLLEAIKKLYPCLPVMMVTAYGDDERRRRASSLGAAEFITKPIDFDLLKAWLRQLPNAAAWCRRPRYLPLTTSQNSSCSSSYCLLAQCHSSNPVS